MQQMLHDHHLAHYLADSQSSGSRFLTPETTCIGISQLLELTNHYGLAEITFQNAREQAMSALGLFQTSKIHSCTIASIAFIGMLKPSK